MKRFALLLIFSFAPLAASNGKLIILYGTAYSGKSSIAQLLEKELPGNFRTIHKNDIIHNPKNQNQKKRNAGFYGNLPGKRQSIDASKAKPDLQINQLEEKLHSGENIILDACIYHVDLLEQMQHLKPIYVLVYAPISDLSDRETQLSFEHNNSIVKRESIRCSILSAFLLLYQPVSPEKCYAKLKKNEVVDFYLETRDKWVNDPLSHSAQKIISEFQLKSEGSTPFAPRKKPTVFIDTHKMTTKESVRMIIPNVVQNMGI